jgi:hypothetical protein
MTCGRATALPPSAPQQIENVPPNESQMLTADARTFYRRKLHNRELDCV